MCISKGLLLASLFFLLEIGLLHGQSVCLNMIVKNESHVIRRCLASVKPFIDHWVIVDTGSTDGTQNIIKEFMKDVPGELYECPWVDFAHNRNEALKLAKNKGDYVFFIDADETLSFDEGFIRPHLDKDSYYITISCLGMKYDRILLINNHLNWLWKGVLHEYLECAEAKTVDHLKGITNLQFTDGARSQDPQKYQKDARLLEAAVREDPANQRYVFYLAQSYKDAGDYASAVKNYQKRIELGGWDQEIFWSKLEIALLQEKLNASKETVIQKLIDAHLARPSRVEPLYYLANYCRMQGDYEDSYRYALLGLTLSESSDALFVMQWMYDYGLLLELSIAAYWTEKYSEALLASQLLLKNPSLPENVKECVIKNLEWINSKMKMTTNLINIELLRNSN